MQIVATAKDVNSKNAPHVKWYNIAVLTVKEHIVHSTKENARNVLLNCTKRLYSKNIHLQTIVLSVFYPCHSMEVRRLSNHAVVN